MSNIAIKPLVWVKHPRADLWRCDTIVGLYQVSSVVSPASWTLDGRSMFAATGTADGEQAAKDAVQTDFEARIRTVLIAQEVTTSDVCLHEEHTAYWDHIRCNSCGCVKTDSGFGLAKNKWFKNMDEAKFYNKNGRLPDPIA